MADKLPPPLNHLGPSDPMILLQILPMLEQKTSELDEAQAWEQPGIPMEPLREKFRTADEEVRKSVVSCPGLGQWALPPPSPEQPERL
jgi:hypothetical protein